jgi:glycosyltransferase involved in cell wall biosynthesis
METLKIGIISRWKATCGISLHAELIANEFMKMGHEIVVFAPKLESANKWWHHVVIGKDEPFVIRCYEEKTPDGREGKFDPNYVLSQHIDYLIVESYPCLPHRDVERIVRKLNAISVAVVHEQRQTEFSYSNPNVFDAIAVFDERFAKEVVCNGNTVIIPYPCHPIVKGSRKFAEDKLRFFTFGRQPAEEYVDFIKALDWLSSRYDFEYLVVRSNHLLPFERSYLVQMQRRLSLDEVYKYIHSSDIHLIPKAQTDGCVVSSTLCQCLGALTPTVVPNTRHFEMLPSIDGFKPAVVYDSVEDLKSKLVKLIEDEEFRRGVIRSAERFVEVNRCDKIAKEFLKLYKDAKTIKRKVIQIY